MWERKTFRDMPNVIKSIINIFLHCSDLLLIVNKIKFHQQIHWLLVDINIYKDIFIYSIRYES